MISRPSSRSGARRRPGPWPKSSQRALQQAFPEGSLRLRGGHRGCPHLPSLPRKPPRQATHDQHARASVQGGKEEDEGGRGLPQRDEREHASDGDSPEEQRGVGAKALPHHGRSSDSRETKPTTFETLTRTALIGKYLNGYKDTTYVPPGWDYWFVTWGEYFNYNANDNGSLKHFGTSSSDYRTAVEKRRTLAFIDASVASREPFFAYLAPKAPHLPATPAPRDRHTFDQEKAPRLASFNEADVSDKPPWIQSQRMLTSTDIANIDQRHEDRVESLQAVDDLVAAVVGKLGAEDVLSNTYIVFTSDNGWHHGEHRIQRGKARPYEEDIRVPLVIRGPAVQPHSSTDKLVLNTDYFPTFMDLAGAQTPTYGDGRSLLPVLTGSATTSWRTAILIEGRKHSADPEIPVDRNYEGIRTSTSKYIEYEGGSRELYNLTPGADPYELTNTYYSADPTVPPRRDLKARLEALKGCQPQDDPTTPEVETPCQAAEGGP